MPPLSLSHLSHYHSCQGVYNLPLGVTKRETLGGKAALEGPLDERVRLGQLPKHMGLETEDISRHKHA